jgi:hypothetical protein
MKGKAMETYEAMLKTETEEAEELLLALYWMVHKKQAPCNFWKYKNLSHEEIWKKVSKFLGNYCP